MSYANEGRWDVDSLIVAGNEITSTASLVVQRNYRGLLEWTIYGELTAPADPPEEGEATIVTTDGSTFAGQAIRTSLSIHGTQDGSWATFRYRGAGALVERSR